MSSVSAWDERFAGAEYAFGTEPASFLAREAGRLRPGQTALLLADGEGRNSVFLAGCGIEVTAMDASARGLDKARALAAARGVAVEFRRADILDWDWQERVYDAVIGIFMQFLSPAERARVFDGIARAVAAGGLVMLHGYAPRQIGYGTGGPKSAENLYTPDLLRRAFPGWEVLVARDDDADLAEGTRHVGRSALVDFVARKPTP